MEWLLIQVENGPPKLETAVFGNFGSYERSTSSGQIVRTREVSAAIASHDKVRKHTNINYGSQKMAAIIQLLGLLRRDIGIFVLPGPRMLVILGIFLAAARGLGLITARTHLVAIGGWLPLMAQTHRGKIAIGGFTSLSTQLPSMTKTIERPKEKYWLPNFRKFDSSELPPKKPSDVIRIVHISRLLREKGVFESIETARELEKHGVAVRLSIYGPDEFASDADRADFYAQVAKAQDSVKYCGELPYAEVIPMIATQDYVLFPSTFADEGFPGVIVESLIAATPVLALDVGYVSEISEHYEFGFMVRAPFPPAAADIIMRHRLGTVPAALGAHELSNHSRAWAWFEEICFP